MLPEARHCFFAHVITNDVNVTLQLSRDGASEYFSCNHEEMSTMMVLHALREETLIVVVSQDTDVFVFLVYACAKYKPTLPWFIKTDSERYVKIQEVINHFGEALCLKLPRIHCLTGCDTTSYPFGVGKVKVLKKLVSVKDALSLLEGLGDSETVSQDLERSIKTFVQLICYSGVKDESYVDTRVRMYQKMKVKSSMSLPADPESLTYSTCQFSTIGMASVR